MRVAVAAGLLLIGALWAGPAAAQVYRWVEADGTIHFSTGLESVPEAASSPSRPSRFPSILIAWTDLGATL
jgi:hypothetical protein